MPSYRQRGAGRSTSPDRNVQGGGASLRGGGASLRGGRASARGGRASARGGGVSARGGGGASLRGGGLSFQGIDGSTVNDRPPPRPEPISYAQPENRPFVSVSESSVASDESTLLQPNGFKKVQQPLRSTSAASTESAEDEIIFTPRHGHTRARGSTLKAAISPYAGLGGGASLKVADDHASSSSGYATSVDEQAVQEKEKLKVGTSLATKSEPKPAQTPARRQGSLVDSGEATIAPLSAGTRVHQLSTQSRQESEQLASKLVHMDDMAAAKPAPSVDTADMPKKRHQNRNSGNPGNTNTTQSRVVESAAAVDSVASTGHNQLEQSIFGSYTGNNQQPQPRQTTVAQATTAPPYAAQGALSPGFKFPLQRQTVVDPLVVADYGQAKQHVSIGSTQMPQRRQTIIHSPERTQTSSTATQVYLPPHKRDTLVSGPSADYSQNTVNSYPDAGTPSQVALLNNLRRQTIGARQSQGATHHRGASLPQNTVLYGSQITSISQNFDPITEEPTVAPGSPGHHHHAPSGVAGLGGISGSLSDPNIGRYRAVQDTGVGNSRSLVVYDPPATMDVSNAMVLRPDDHGVTTVGPLPLVNPDSEEMAKRSDVLRALTERGRPTVLDIGSDTFLPFVESTSFEFQNSKADVVHINNLPYEVTQQEIHSLLVNTYNGLDLDQKQEPIHIIMDRINGKTMDAYVEMPEHQARVLMYRIEQKRASGRALFLGRRPVNITLSTQAQLMKALFPHAHVDWHGAKPYVIRNSPWSFQNFKCFFTDEEMVMLAKHTNPTQSSFAKLCPERVYECMISTIRKLPWSQTDYINMAQRHLLFETAINMVKTLNKRLDFMEKRHKEQSSCPSPHPSATLVPIGSGGGGGAMQHGHNGYPTGPRAIMPPGNANQHGYGQFQSVQNNNGNVQGNMPLNFPHNLIADARGNGGGNGRRFGRANGRRNGGGHGRSDSQNVQGHAQGAQGVQGQASKEPKEDKPKDNRAPEEFYEGRLTEALRNRLAVTCMMCPGFTVVQKDWFGEVIGMAHEERSQLNLPYFSAGWLHLYSLCPKGGMPYDLLSYYIALIREETTRVKDSLPMSQRKALEKKQASTNGYFGYLWVELDLPTGADFDNMTLRQINKLEWDAIDRVLRRALMGGVVGPQWFKNHDI